MMELDGLIHGLFMVEVTLCAVLLIPFGNNLKQRVVEWFDSQHWLTFFRYVLWVILCLVIYMFVDAYRSVSRLGEFRWAKNKHEYMKAQRDQYLLGFVLLMSLMLWRSYSMMRSNNRLEKSLIAMKKQAKNASDTCRIVMDEKDVLQKRLDQIRQANGDFSASTDDEPGDNKLKSELTAEIVRAKKDLEAMKAQTTGQQVAFMRLQEENERLREQLEDFELLMGDAKKKNV